MSREDLLRLVHSHDTVWAGWWPPLLRLPSNDARRRTTGSFPSVLATSAHMVAAEIYWQDRLEGLPLNPDPPFQGMADLNATWCRLQARRNAYLHGAAPCARVHFASASGDTVSVAVWECLVHVVSHAHFHRGQLASQFRELGFAPPSRHLIGAFFGEYRSDESAAG